MASNWDYDDDDENDDLIDNSSNDDDNPYNSNTYGNSLMTSVKTALSSVGVGRISANSRRNNNGNSYGFVNNDEEEEDDGDGSYSGGSDEDDSGTGSDSVGDDYSEDSDDDDDDDDDSSSTSSASRSSEGYDDDDRSSSTSSSSSSFEDEREPFFYGGDNNSRRRIYVLINKLLSKVRKLLLSPLKKSGSIHQWVLSLMIIFLAIYIYQNYGPNAPSKVVEDEAEAEEEEVERPEYVFHPPYVSSSYYLSTKSIETLIATENLQVKRIGGYGELANYDFKTRLAVVRPFCEFDADALPTTFAVWNQLAPCRAAATDLDFNVDVDKSKNKTNFDDVGADVLKEFVADVFLFYSQTFSENDVAIKSCDAIINQFMEPGGWSQCFANIYAIEANIPQELDLYIPSAQETLYNWVNGPNRQFEAAFRIIQSGEWGFYDGFYLMEGDSIPVKNHWLDVILSEVEANRPFAILGAKYNGDKWDLFYEKIPLSLLHHINGNAIYNTSHPLMERLVGQLEVEAPCPYNSIPYDYRMSQMCVEGALRIVPELAPKIMLNEEGQNITLSNNTDQFSKWWDMHKHETPMKETPAIHNYAATNLIPRHLGPEYVIHGAKLYAPWNPSLTKVTLVISEWFFDRSAYLLAHLDEKDHPFSEAIVMLPPTIEARDDYQNLTVVPTRAQHRTGPDFMDLCEAEVTTDWFMITNSYHVVATHVDLMFTPGKFQPVCPFTPATYPFCFKFPYCKENVNHAQKFNPGHDKVVLDFDMLYNTKERNKFCTEWKERFGDEGQNLYRGRRKIKFKAGKIAGPSGPTGTSYAAYLFREGKDKMYKFTDRSLYGARDPFIKVFAKEEKEDGMTEEEKALRALTARNLTQQDCNCKAFESQEACEGSPLGCIWRPLFESCRPPEMIDGGVPICPTTDAPTSAPTEHDPLDDTEAPTEAPTKAPYDDPWFASMFNSKERKDDIQTQKDIEDQEKKDREERAKKRAEELNAEVDAFIEMEKNKEMEELDDNETSTADDIDWGDNNEDNTSEQDGGSSQTTNDKEESNNSTSVGDESEDDKATAAGNTTADPTKTGEKQA